MANDFSGCMQNDPLIVCSTGKLQAGIGFDASAEQQEAIFILSNDDGPGGTRTSAAQLRAVLGESYDVTDWSTRRDGIPTSSDLKGYDAYIVDSGDYVFDTKDSETFSVLTQIDGSRLMFIGAQPCPSLGGEVVHEPINDLEIAAPMHPLAANLAPGQIISLLAADSDVPALVMPGDEEYRSSSGGFMEIQVVFRRGPGSPASGKPALIAATGNGNGNIKRLIVATFASYRLPKEAQSTFALNAAKWLLER
jgi:hypothetical protein